MATPKRRGRAVSAGREYRAGGSAAAGQTPHNCAWISNFLSPSDHLAPLIARGAFSTGSGNRQLQIINDRMHAKPEGRIHLPPAESQQQTGGCNHETEQPLRSDRQHFIRRNQWFADSSLERGGFKPSVPQRRPSPPWPLNLLQP